MTKAHARHLESDAGATAASLEPAVVIAQPTATVKQPARVVPIHAVYSDPWVQHNVVLTYAPETTRDGLGAQAFRMLGIHAIARALGLPFLNTPPECVGHIGGAAHYQGMDCTRRMTAADQHKLARVKRMLMLPNTGGVSGANTRSWHVERLDDTLLTWEALQNVTQTALQHKQPTVIKLARVQSLLCQYPDVFLSVPQLKPAANHQHQLQLKVSIITRSSRCL